MTPFPDTEAWMDLRLTDEDRELQDKARRFTDEHLIPHEDECEEHDGLTLATWDQIRAQVLAWGFNAINHSREDGGQGLSIFQQVLVEEQWGHATGALWDVPGRPSIPLVGATPEQKESYLLPA